MRITLVVAAARNGVIGRDGELPWRLPNDLKEFKRLTMGKPVVMGRKTWDSIGRPLPGRHNVVISRTEGLGLEGATVVASPEAALELLSDEAEIMVIGGGAIYRAFLDQASRIYLTEVDADVDGDTTFPAFDPVDWVETSATSHPADDRHAVGYTFKQLDRSG